MGRGAWWATVHGVMVGYSPWGRQELDTTEAALQCSCLENPGDGGAWWAAVYEVAQSRT